MCHGAALRSTWPSDEREGGRRSGQRRSALAVEGESAHHPGRTTVLGTGAPVQRGYRVYRNIFDPEPDGALGTADR